MDWSSSKNWAARVGAVAMAFVLGASASAGTLYSWKTDDGTYAYTNEKKRVPAKYKKQAESSKLKSMSSYSRYTPGPKSEGKAYADRIVERLEVLRASRDQPVSSGGGAGVDQPYFVRLGLGNNGEGGSNETNIEIPVGAGMDDAEPVVVEYVRMKPGKGRTTTRHFRIVKQGDRVLAVIKDRGVEHRPSKLNQEDFDSNPLE